MILYVSLNRTSIKVILNYIGVRNFLLVGLCLSWRHTVNDIYFFLTFIL